jgi:environmental stress-induced protein Ves
MRSFQSGVHHLSVLFWNSKAIKIDDVAETFKISTNQEEINMDPILLFAFLDSFIDSIELTVTATFNSDVQMTRHSFDHWGSCVSQRHMAGREKVQRPLTAWIIYCNEHRATIKEANPTFGFKDMARALSEGFKALSEEERASYDLKASQEKERSR